MSEIIKPKILKGFRDSLPQDEILRKKTIRTLEDVFKSYGFDPIDTPVLEYTEVLLGKGGGETDKQVYSFLDGGKRDVSMRFDLTVPFSRFMAANYNSLQLPFKRYHIDKVWRGENTQKGRYREFYQCDFDIVGCDTAESDLEILLMMNASFEALGISDITFNIAHRGIFNAFLEYENIFDNSVEILRIVDKLAKIGEEKVIDLLTQIITIDQANKILSYIKKEDTFEETLSKLEKLCGGTNDSIERLSQIHNYLKAINLDKKFTLNPSITRGLDYYTGIVYETFLNELPSIGSVCSGGRYNDLASLYTKQELPGVGSSIGLDRLLAGLKELSNEELIKTETEAVIFLLEKDCIEDYIKLSETVRKKGIKCEMFLKSAKLQKQFSYAEKKGIPFAFICGKDEFDNSVYTIKDLNNRKNYDKISLDEAIKIIKG